MATLNNTRISDTYPGLIKTLDNTAISATLKQLSDGDGTATGLSINNAGDFKVNAILEFGSLKDTGENIIISKFVDAADGIGNNDNDTSIPTSAAVVSYVASVITAEDLDFTGDDAGVSGDVDLNSEKFRILGTANEIETSVVSAGGNQLRIGLPTSISVNLVGDVTGNITGIGILSDGSTAVTQSAGNSTTKIATTKFVMDLDAGSDLDFSGDSGTGDVTLNTQTFAITGTTNQIQTTASNQGLSLNFPTAGITLPNGSVATTQASSDSSTKVATTAYVKGLDNASDLDITDGTTAGDVNLNTQSLSILGTANQVVSTVSNQSVTLSLPSSINVNSASATILQNARDISLTGEASATISSFNGSANVSGAVTLDNDSVIGKVLTGLASPTATNILASDSILQAFGKTQSQLNTLAGGLRFMGTWNATTNTPTLASGGGEADSGTTTGTATNKLIQSSQNFTSTVTNGDQVVNQASGATALVTNVDSNTQLTLDADIMVSGQAYTIDNSPFLQQGHYFVVSVGGTSSLNGLSNWAVGDWVIAGATNVWEKLDHTQVDGTGTVGNITKWSSTNVIADSIMAETGSGASALVTATGSIAATQLLSSGGNFAVNTNKFTANATTGNIVAAGTGTFGGDVTATSKKFIATSSSSGDYVRMYGASGTGQWDIYGNGENLRISENSSGGGVLAVDSGATFGGNVAVNGDATLGDGTADDHTINGQVTHLTGDALGYKLHRTTGGTSMLISASSDAEIEFGTDNGSGTNTTQWSIGKDASDNSFRISNSAALGTSDAFKIDSSKNSTFSGAATGDNTIFIAGSRGAANNLPAGNITFRNVANGVGDVDLTKIQSSTGTGSNQTQKGQLTFSTNNGSSLTEAMRIDSSQNATFAGQITANINASGNNVISTFKNANTTAGNRSAIKVVQQVNASGSFSAFLGSTIDGKVFLSNDSITANHLLIDTSGNSTFNGSVTINHNSGDTLILTKTTTEPSMRFQGDTNKDFCLTISGDDFTITQNDGVTDILALDHDTKNAAFSGSITGTTSSFNSPVAGTTVVSAEGAYAGSGSVKLFEAKRNGGAVKSDWDYHDSSPIRMSIGTSTSHSFAIKTADTPRLTINNIGNVGIGTNDPDYTLHLLKSSGDTEMYINGQNGQSSLRMGLDARNWQIKTAAAPYLWSLNYVGTDFQTPNIITATTGGNVAIGGTANNKLEISDTESTTGSTYLKIARGADGTAVNRIAGIKLGNTASNDGSNWIVQANSSAGHFDSATLEFDHNAAGTATTRFSIGSTGFVGIGRVTNSYKLSLVTDSTIQNGVYISGGTGSGNHAFYVENQDGSSEHFAVRGDGQIRMNASRAGNILFGTTSLSTITGGSPSGSGFGMESSGRVTLFQGTTSTAAMTMQAFYNPNGQVGRIATNGSGTGFFTSSDYRLKEDLKDFNGLEKVSEIPVYDFKWKTDENRSYGVMAHELQKVLPDAVSGDKDAEEMQSVDYSKIVPLLVKSIQELKAEVDLLKQECKCK